MGVGPLSLGYAYPRVDEAIRAQLEDGITFSLMHPLEVEVAELVRGMVPERRAGALQQDRLRRHQRRGAPGARVHRPRRRPLLRLSRLARLVHRRHRPHRRRARDHPRPDPHLRLQRPRLGRGRDGRGHRLRDPRADRLRGAARPASSRRSRPSAASNGTLLVFDEMWTGFRLALGGAQEAFGVAADLACFSKAIANGMPLSVLTGRADVMRLLEERRLLLHDLRRRGPLPGRGPGHHPGDAGEGRPGLPRGAGAQAAGRLQRARCGARHALHAVRRARLPLPRHLRRQRRRSPGDEVPGAAGADAPRGPLERVPQRRPSPTPTPTSTLCWPPTARRSASSAPPWSGLRAGRPAGRAGRAGLPPRPPASTRKPRAGVDLPMSRFSLDGRVAVVTGAAGLLGRRHCAALAGAGAHVVATDLDREACGRVVEDAVGAATGARPSPWPATSPMRASVAALRGAILDWRGRIDVLVNNAAMNEKVEDPGAGGAAHVLRELSPGALAASLEVNVTGTFLCCQVLGSEMAARKRGSIVNIASTYGLVAPDQSLYREADGTQSFYKSAAYPTTKGAVLGLHTLPGRLLGRRRRAGQRPLARRGRERPAGGTSGRDTPRERRSGAWPSPTTTRAPSSFWRATHRLHDRGQPGGRRRVDRVVSPLPDPVVVGGGPSLAERARRTKLVLTDCDGVLTDGGVYYSAAGEDLKRFSLRDGMGVERLRRAGIATAISPARTPRSWSVAPRSSACRTSSPASRTRAPHLEVILARTGLALEEIGVHRRRRQRPRAPRDRRPARA